MSRSKYINTFNTTAEYDAYIDSAYPEFPNVGYDKQAGVVNIRRQSPNNYQIWGTLSDPSQAPVFNFNRTTSNVGGQSLTATVEGNEFYIQNLTGVTVPITGLSNFANENTNILTIKKINFNTSNVTYFGTTSGFTAGMFTSLSNITKIDTSSLDLSSAKCLKGMFGWCSKITSIDLSQSNISSSVTNIASMFASCTLLSILDLSSCDFSNVTNQSSIFDACSSLTDVYITVEATLMKLTNNLTSQGGDYIPSNSGNCTIHYNDVDYKWQNNAWTPQNV